MGNACYATLNCTKAPKPLDAHWQLISLSIRGLTADLAGVANINVTIAQLGPLEGAVLGNICRLSQLLLALSHPGHKSMTVKSTYAREIERRGNAQSGKLRVNAPSPVGAQQWAPCISECAKLSSGSNDRRCM